MSTPVFDPYEAIRQACLVETDTKSEPSKDPIDSETPESPHAIASPTPLPDSTPPACHTKELEDSDMFGARSTSSDSTAPLSPDHLLTRTSPTPTPTRALFHRRTARMTVHAQPVMSLGHSARVAEAMALSDSALHTDSKEEEIGGEDTDEDEGHGLDDEDRSVESDGHGLEGEEKVVPEGQQQAASVIETAVGEPLGLGYRALRHQDLAIEEDQVYSTFKVRKGYGSVPEPERPERVSTLRQPTLTTWIDLEDDITYIDIPACPPPAPPAQTPPSPEWSSSLLSVSPAPSAVPSPISSPMISLTIPSPTPKNKDQFIEIGA
ncbi:hypothetical protein Tco_1154115 [Tanacetum coccineum]